MRLSEGYQGFALGPRGIRVGSARVFRYQHVGIGNAKLPNARPQREGVGFAVEYRLMICRCRKKYTNIHLLLMFIIYILRIHFIRVSF